MIEPKATLSSVSKYSELKVDFIYYPSTTVNYIHGQKWPQGIKIFEQKGKRKTFKILAKQGLPHFVQIIIAKVSTSPSYTCRAAQHGGGLSP